MPLRLKDSPQKVIWFSVALVFVGFGILLYPIRPRLNQFTMSKSPASTSASNPAPARENKTVSNLSVWVLPAQNSPENKSLQGILDDLAAKHNKSTYLPHATLAIINLPPTPDADSPELKKWKKDRADLSKRVESVLQELKHELFSSRITFDHLFYNHAAMMVEGKKDEKLLELQRRFHEDKRVDKELIVKWFPHFSIAYNNGGKDEKEADIKELEAKGLYKKKSDEEGGGIELGGYDGFKVGAIYGAYCGDLRPEKWKIFLKIEEDESAGSA